MLKYFSTILFTCSVFTSTGFAQAPNTPPPAKKKGYKFSAVALTPVDQSSIYFIPTTVEGKPVNMLLDTGAGAPFVFSTKYAKSLHKELKQKVNSTTASGSAKTYSATFSNIRIGKRYGTPKIDALVLKLSHLNKFKINGEQRIPDGLVGAKFFSTLRAIVDYEHNAVLFPPSQAKNTTYARSRKAKKDLVLPLTRGAYGYLYVNIKVKDQTYAFLVDSAATVNTIDPAIAKELNLESKVIPGSIGGAGGNTESGQKMVTVKNPLLGGKIQLASLNFYLIPGHTFSKGLPKGTKVGGIFGSQYLKHFGAKLDFGAPALIFPRAKFQKK